MLLALFASAGFLAGLGGYTFRYAEGTSYLSDDPEACVNCHVMRDQFESWNHSSHRNWATCNDCHTPTAFVGKWFTKAVNGYNHSVKFTTGHFPEPIVIRERNRRIALDNCVQCHAILVSQMAVHPGRAELDCVFCHGNVGH